jgi:drug/metabolite transporter (DMT)-like permease
MESVEMGVFGHNKDTSPAKVHPSASPKDLKMKMALAVCGTAMWGFSSVFVKYILNKLDPLPYLAISLFGSSSFLWTIAIITRKPRPSMNQVMNVCSIGILYPGLASMLTNLGLEYCTVTSETLIWSLESLMVIGLASLILGERASWQVYGLAILAFVGVVLLTMNEADDEVSEVTVEALQLGAGDEGEVEVAIIPVQWARYFGYLCVIFATLCSSLYTVFSRKALALKMDPLILISIHQTVGFLFSAVCCLIWLTSDYATFPLLYTNAAIGHALLAGIWGSGLPMWLFFGLLADVDASVSVVLTSLIPVFGIAGAVMFLGETVEGIQWVGVFLVLVSTYFISKLE